MEDDLKDFIQGILVICEALSNMIAAALILRVVLLPSWENFGEAMLFTFLTLLINWSNRKELD